MKKLIILFCFSLLTFASFATIHIVRVWDGYYQFISADITIQLGDTVQWLPLDVPSSVHTITSTNIPSGADSFDQIWQAPADTFFQYVPQIAGLYQYVCTPHVSFGMVGSITVLNGTSAIPDNNPAPDELGIYPNPSTGIIRFTESATLFDYNVYNTGGKILLSDKRENFLDISGLPNGVYFLEITGNEPKTFSIIKK